MSFFLHVQTVYSVYILLSSAYLGDVFADMYDLLFASSPALAAIDLGFNSFRLEIARIAKNRYQRQLCVEQMVSLGAGLDSRGVLSREDMARGLR